MKSTYTHLHTQLKRSGTMRNIENKQITNKRTSIEVIQLLMRACSVSNVMLVWLLVFGGVLHARLFVLSCDSIFISFSLTLSTSLSTFFTRFYLSRLALPSKEIFFVNCDKRFFMLSATSLNVIVICTLLCMPQCHTYTFLI